MSGPSRLRPKPEPPAAIALDALTLLETGRAGMAFRLLHPLPELIMDEIGRAYTRGHDEVVQAYCRRSGADGRQAPRRPLSVIANPGLPKG